MKEKIALLETKASKARHTERVATDRAKDAEKKVSKVKDTQKKAKEMRKKAEDDLTTAQSKHSRFLQEALPIALDQA